MKCTARECDWKPSLCYWIDAYAAERLVTEWSRSVKTVIIRVIYNKFGRPRSGSPICFNNHKTEFCYIFWGEYKEGIFSHKKEPNEMHDTRILLKFERPRCSYSMWCIIIPITKLLAFLIGSLCTYLLRNRARNFAISINGAKVAFSAVRRQRLENR